VTGARPASDFLSRLAIRALGAGPAAAPRAAGTFEPAGAGGDLGAGDVERVVASALGADPVEAGAPRRGASGAPVAMPRPGVLRLAHPAAAAAERQHLAAAEDGRPPAADASAPAQAQPVEPESAPPASEAVAAPRLEGLRPAEPGLGEGAALRPNGQEARIVSGPSVTGSPDEEAPAGRPVRRGPPEPPMKVERPGSLAAGPPAAERAAFTAPVAVMLPASPAPRDVGAIPLAEPEAPAEPVVNVTIGRIEVRAAAPAPASAPRAAPRPPPPESLGDYLKRRNGGR
jgi:hypothetical protein